MKTITKSMKRAKEMPRFAFFGTPRLAAEFLSELEAAGLIPTVLVTVPDKKRERGLLLSLPPTKQWAAERTIPVLQPDQFDDSFIETLQNLHLDVFIVIYYGKVLPSEVLKIPKRGTLNVHFSLLPRYRGTSPVRAAILNNDRDTGTSIILLDEKIDHGPLIAQKKISTENWPLFAHQLEEQMTRESARLLTTILPSWMAGEIEPREQNHDVATYCPTLSKEDGLLDLSKNAYNNLLKIRALDSTIGTYTFFERNEKRIRVGIMDAHIEGEKLVIDSVKPEGKREMKYEEFLRSGAKPLT